MATYRSSQLSTTKVTISGTPTLIPGLTGAPFLVPPPKRDDITNLDSIGGFSEELVVGKEIVEETIEGIWDHLDSTHEYLLQATLNGSTEAFTVQPLGSTKTLTFSATVHFKPKLEPMKAMRYSLTFRMTGAPTWA